MSGEKTKKKKPHIAILIAVLLAGCMACTWIPVTERLTVDIKGKNTGNVRIALVTDLHSCYYGKDQQWLISRIEKEDPDLVMLGGDIFDDVLGDGNAKTFLEWLAGRYPAYYVTGNHEFWSGRAEEMKQYVRSIGISVLEGDCESISVNGTDLDICGVDDPDDMSSTQWEAQIQNAYEQTDASHIKILLSHRPEKVQVYEKYGFDLVLAGHAHAGQFRIPFINRGLFAPDQGLMAEYVNGIYELSNGSILAVSRGLGRESTPLPRFFNHPELMILNLE